MLPPFLEAADREYSVSTRAPAEAVWSLVAEPARWHRWAPHLRGAWGLGDPEVEPGARGAARLLGVLPVPARILAVDPGRSWTWQAGPVRLVHAVHPDEAARGSRIVFWMEGPGPLLAAYGPVVHLLMRNLARVAEQDAGLR